jgi:hypothetical protein
MYSPNFLRLHGIVFNYKGERLGFNEFMFLQKLIIPPFT